MRPGVSPAVRIWKVALILGAFWLVASLISASRDVPDVARTPQEISPVVPFEEMYNPSAAALESIQELQAEGETCSEEATLTNHVVIDTRNHLGVVASFDRAYRLAQAGNAWIRSYCQETS